MSNKQNKTISIDEVKAAKMRHYSRRDPNVFVQFDGIYMPCGSDGVISVDDDYEDRCPEKYNNKSCFDCTQREQCYNASPEERGG